MEQLAKIASNFGKKAVFVGLMPRTGMPLETSVRGHEKICARRVELLQTKRLI